MHNCVIFGATSAIAMETAKLFASQGSSLLLISRSDEHFDSIKSDLYSRGASEVITLVADSSDCYNHTNLLAKIEELMPAYDTVLFAYGTLGDQSKAEKDYAVAYKEFEVNFLSVVSLLIPIANRFEAQKKGGTIAVISSVAGDRGRKSNYIYGTSKGALTIFLQGLRNRLASKGVHVLTIKPGWVDTPMTANFSKNKLYASPAVVAEGIFKAIEKKRDVVYLPWFWCPIMMFIKLIPEFIFKRQKLI